MKNKEPFHLKKPLMLWNLALAIFSILGAIVLVPPVISSMREKGFVYTSCVSDVYHSSESSVCFWIFLFMLSKVVELGDTVFVILRKKPLMFLHWYHHVSVLNLTWFIVSRDATGIAHYSSSINYSVHSIMYSYYAATSAGIRFPPVVPPLITLLQIIQMFLVATVNITAFTYHSTCRVDVAVVWAAVIIALSYAALFGNYFVHRYVFKKKKKEV